MSNIATLLNLQAKAAAAVEEATVLREAVDLFAGWREDWPIAAQSAIRPIKPTKGGKERASAHRSMLALLFGSPVLWWAVRGGCKACRLSLFSYPVLIAAYRPPPFLRVHSLLQEGRFSTRRTKTTRQPAGVISGGRKRKNRPCKGGFFITGLAGTPVNGH
ncbi:hypothetical protein BI312_26115 [Xanthomonas citri pv. citri]|uniref:Uncharacterized protein n=2 Tax=Xanthomonas citri TaxID=346 RepID=A0AAI7ZJ85_XANAC|nr:hypothetical protein XACa0003 [Xanthomonas citri pv. citri str. 306]APR13436.1 hypothetical protein BI314_24685 [Xanthomonas citri pv. citri]KAB0529674.1 hypothetical protein F7R02_21870 [Xanthomonas cissicola]APR18111.1 hypothetical protein BI315_24855 [Xanthomonas citri pv. citri]APR27429.1 hypothetical protein BJD09_24685 [Xanthomonas citri pv. citri]